MMIRLHLQSPGFNLQTVLQPEALPHLIELVQKHRVSDPAAFPLRPRPHQGLGRQGQPGGPGGAGKLAGAGTAGSAPEVSASSQQVRARLVGIPAEALLQQIHDVTFPEKILAATAWLQSRRDDGAAPHRREVRMLLVRLGQPPPANPGRDIRTAWKEGWLVEAGERGLAVTNEGWAKIASLLDGPDAAAVPA